MFGVKEGTIRQWANRKKFDPADLQSIVAFATERLKGGPALG